MSSEESAVQKELDLIASWGLHPLRHGDGVLVPRDEAVACLRKLLESEVIDLWGFDTFTLNEDGSLTPHPDFSPDYSEEPPANEEMETELDNAPAEVTHVEFVVSLIEPLDE